MYLWLALVSCPALGVQQSQAYPCHFLCHSPDELTAYTFQDISLPHAGLEQDLGSRGRVCKARPSLHVPVLQNATRYVVVFPEAGRTN